MNTFIQPVIERALTGIDEVQPLSRADLYEGLAMLLEPHAPAEAAEARKTATAIRESEAAQLHFLHLVTNRKEENS